MSELSYCAEQVKGHDRDRYLTSLFAPEPRRARLFALYAFNLEIAKTAEMVSEPILGEIRLQWWRDAIAEGYGGSPRRHQVVQPLAGAIARHGLSRHLFDRMIDAREADFEAAPPERLEHLEAYADATAGALNLLALQILGVRDDRLERAGAAAGRAWALAGTVRGLRHLLLVGRSPLPRDLMEKHGLSHADLQSLKRSDSLCRLVDEISLTALKHIDDSYVEEAGRAKPVLLQTVLARAYLKRLAGTGYDPFDARNARPLAFRTWRLMISALRGAI